MATLTVGAAEQFTTLAAAIAASRDGDLVQVQAGTYTTISPSSTRGSRSRAWAAR